MFNRAVIAVDVYLERRKSREYVGRLERSEDEFIFTYDEHYRYKYTALAVGPELPLLQQQFRSRVLFVSFEDRLPSRRNPAYPLYCDMTGIEPNEEDVFVLLSTIGQSSIKKIKKRLQSVVLAYNTHRKSLKSIQGDPAQAGSMA